MIDKAITDAAMQELNADVICMQEVENVDTLKHFRRPRSRRAGRLPVCRRHRRQRPTLDPRRRACPNPVVSVRSYQHLRDAGQPSRELLSRDCVEVALEWPSPGQVLTVFVQHVKSMLGWREQTAERRRVEAHAVKEIVDDRFGATAGEHPLIICGDFNDYPETDEQGALAITELVQWDQVENVIDRMPRPSAGRTITPAATNTSGLACCSQPIIAPSS
jgi:endonuclease/exonuclease/phosphatase family metal-dependent hydrolase